MTPVAAADASVSVVLPVHRNRPQLPELIDRLATALDATRERWEIVCVDDCGGDGSREWIEERARSDGRVRLVANAANLGQHASILAGLRAARGERTVVMDADLQDAPEDVPSLLAALGPDAAAVFGRRGADSAGSSAWSGRAFKAVLRALSESRIPVGTGTFVAMRRDLRDAVLAIDAGDRPYLQILIARTRLPLAAVDVTRRERVAGNSSYTSLRRLRMGLRAVGQALRWRLFGR